MLRSLPYPVKKRGIYRGAVNGEFGEANNPGFRDSFRPPLLGISLKIFSYRATLLAVFVENKRKHGE